MTNLNLLSTQLDQLVLYRELLQDDLIQQVYQLLAHQEAKTEKKYYEICHQLIKKADSYNLSGNIWKDYLLYLLATAENPFTLAAERQGANISNQLYQTALHDLEIITKLYELDFNQLAVELDTKPIELTANFSLPQTTNSSAADQLQQIFTSSADTEKLVTQLSRYYYSAGTGKLGLYNSFRLTDNYELTPITNPDPVTFADLMNYQTQKEKIKTNTEAFLNDQPANNVLLYGTRGTGKSSSVKALLNEYAASGLRLIEVAKHQLSYLPDLLEQLQERGLYFIIFLDDLSFEEFETEYKYIKAVIEGRVEVKPDNILFYATSNRRHLIKETWQERKEEVGEIHTEDARQEKLSLADRFGLKIKYGTPDQQEYLNIVRGLADKYDIDLSTEELEAKAKQWARWYNGRSGRTAQQFINHLLGK